MNTTRLHSLWNGRAPIHGFRTAVSLHSHTMHSEESLASLPRHVRRVPILRQAARKLSANFSRVYWTPPLPALNAFQLERDQIEDRLGLAALVSLTDHDNIQASTRLQLLDSMHGVPVSLEWTVPLAESFLHIGIHNLPRALAHAWVQNLRLYTRRPSRELLGQLLAGLNELKGTLVVLNHPLWDEPETGAATHLRMVREFLENHGQWIHALELNGLRPWPENRAVLQLAGASGNTIISGGDRHGSAPNPVLNLTNTASFDEFAAEIRQRRMSQILLTPQFRGPFNLRWIECALDIVRDYPELAGRHHWSDRAFYRHQDGSSLPLSAHWSGGALQAEKYILSIVRLFESRPLRSALRAVLAVHQQAAV
jgi:hypothetical protein